MRDNIEKLAADNLKKFLKDGPRLRSDYNTWVEARDLATGCILIGGLGGVGVGQMWIKEKETDKDRPGYADAPNINCGCEGKKDHHF